MIRQLLVTLCLLSLLAPAVPAQTQGQPAPPQEPLPNQPPPPVPSKIDEHPAGNPPAIQPLGDDRYRIGTLIVDRKKREVRFPGMIALVRGVLEYLACGPEGKLYESLLRADVEAYHLHLGLLLIGLQPVNSLQYQGDPNRPAGDPVIIEVEWDTDKGRVRHRAEDLIWEQANNRTMQHTTWAFTGSFFSDGGYAASMTKSLIAVYNDPSAILNNPLPTGGDDTSYQAHTPVLPPVTTEIEFVLRPGPRAKGGS